MKEVVFRGSANVRRRQLRNGGQQKLPRTGLTSMKVAWARQGSKSKTHTEGNISAAEKTRHTCRDPSAYKFRLINNLAIT